eukprot:UN22250
MELSLYLINKTAKLIYFITEVSSRISSCSFYLLIINRFYLLIVSLRKCMV